MIEGIYNIVESNVEVIPDVALSVEHEEGNYAKIKAEPLNAGWGVTVGNSLRRVMLSSLPGAAITSVKVDEALHEFTTLPNVKEEINEILLNLKGVRLHANVKREGRLRIEAEGPGVVTAGDILSSSDFDVVNPEHYIATLEGKGSTLSLELRIEQGTGVKVAKQGNDQIIGEIAIDAVFTPIKKVNFFVLPKRVGERTDFETLFIETWTDGSIAPVEAVNSASKMLSTKFHLLSGVSEPSENEAENGPSHEVNLEVYNRRIEDLGLSPRTLNSLRRANLQRVADVMALSQEQLAGIRNFGAKSLAELQSIMVKIGATPKKD